MMVMLTVVRYKSWLAWAGFLSMAIFRLPLMLNRNISFFKLMGSGKNGTFDIVPDLQQWALLVALKPEFSLHSSAESLMDTAHGKFINGWYKFFGAKQCTIVLEPIEGNGLWDKKEVFGALPKSTDHEGLIAVLTRATIRLSKVKSFWKNVAYAAGPLSTSPGFITSVGIGEIPWIKQATFSIWESKQSMKNYAYQTRQHAEIMRKTRKEDWYAEEMFIRFKVLAASGDLEMNSTIQRYL